MLLFGLAPYTSCALEGKPREIDRTVKHTFRRQEMVYQMPGWNDAALLISLLYLGADLLFEWDEFKSCHRPIHKWLFGSYALVLISRCVCILGSLLSQAPAGSFLLNLREKDSSAQMLMRLTWMALLPGFAAWTVVGSLWIKDILVHTPQCTPGGAHLWFLAIWQLLSYFWILIHGVLGGMAWFLEKQIRHAEGQLRQLEDPDTVARWGRVSQLAYGNLPSLGADGLAPEEILNLPGASEACADAEECECPICLTGIQGGDQVRKLLGCSHSFHRSCIDLWLMRRADCPLCKCKVEGLRPEGIIYSV